MSDKSVHREIAHHVAPNWNRAREAAVLTGIQHRRKIQRVRTGIALSMAAALTAAILTVFLSRGEPNKSTHASPMASTDGVPAVTSSIQPIELSDGSIATPVNADSRMVIDNMTETLISVRITRGGGTFNVAPNKDRLFEVTLNEVTITVVGTSFEITQDGDRTRVRVNRGHVRVGWPGGEADLFGGQQGIFPPVTPVVSDEPSEATPAEKKTKPAAQGSGRAWRTMAQRGEFEKASTLLSDGAHVKDTVDDLLLAADAMRLSRNPGKALSYLHRISQNHAADPRASLAEFTRGRILLFQLNRPKQAVEAFAAARRLSPGSSLAQDALAREVEALSKSGNYALSKTRAEAYIRKYPNGRRLNAVKRYGKIGP